MRGRLPKPSGIREIEGMRGHRPLPKHEPKYRSEAPAKPKGISRSATKIYDEMVDEMAGARVLNTTDGAALWQLAEDEALLKQAYRGIWDMVDALKKKAQTEGKTLPGGPLLALLSMTSGRLAMASVRDLAARVIIERREFGLTPSSRARIQAGDDASVMDSLEAKLCG